MTNRTTLSIDRNEIIRYCRLLGPIDIPHHVSLIPEAPGATAAMCNYYDLIDRLFGAIEVANRQGCGAFICVNETKGNRRRKSDVSKPRAVHRDVDHPPVPDLPIEASARVATSPNRWQDTILVDPFDPPSLCEAAQINLILAESYGGDPHARDIVRLVRLPGTWHVKAKPFLAKIVSGNGRRYSRSELLAAFPSPPQLQYPPPTPLVRVQHDRYIAAAVHAIIRELASAREGSRNSTLNWSAFRLGQLGLCRDDGYACAQCRSRLANSARAYA